MEMTKNFVEKELDAKMHISDDFMRCELLEVALDKIFGSYMTKLENAFSKNIKNYCSGDFADVLHMYASKELSKELMKTLKPLVAPCLKKLEQISECYIEVADFRANLKDKVSDNYVNSFLKVEKTTE